jgi:hypothetical protein
MSDRELILEHSQSIQGFFWFNTGDHWTIDLEVLSEFLDIGNKVIDTKNQVLLEVSLLSLKIITDLNGFLYELCPDFVQNGGCIGLILSSKLRLIGVKQIIHINYGSEIDLDLRLLLSDFLKSRHNITKTIDVLWWFVNLDSDLLDVISQVLKKGLSSLVKIS